MQMRCPNCSVLIGWGSSQSILLIDRWNQGFPAVVDSGVNKWCITQGAKSSVWDSSWSTEYMRSQCQQMATRLLLFIKFRPSVDYGEPISADKFLLRPRVLWQIQTCLWGACCLMEVTASVLTSTMIKGANHKCREKRVFVQNTLRCGEWSRGY